MPLCQIFQLDTKIKKNHLKIGASWLVNAFVQAGIFGKVAIFIIFMVYFNILKSKVLVH